MITKDLVDILKILVDKPIEEMSPEELRKNYEDLLNVMLGMMIGSKFTTEEIKELLKKKKVGDKNG